MFGLGLPELFIILVIVLIIFGAKRLPELGGGLGKAIRSFKDGLSAETPNEKDVIDTSADKKQLKG